jgi:hypothetical protein
MPKCLGERAAAGLSQLHTAAVELRGCFCLQILSMRYLTTGCWISSLRLELLSCRGNNVWDNKLKTSTIKEWLCDKGGGACWSQKPLFLNHLAVACLEIFFACKMFAERKKVTTADSNLKYI